MILRWLLRYRELLAVAALLLGLAVAVATRCL